MDGLPALLQAEAGGFVPKVATGDVPPPPPLPPPPSGAPGQEAANGAGAEMKLVEIWTVCMCCTCRNHASARRRKRQTDDSCHVPCSVASI